MSPELSSPFSLVLVTVISGPLMYLPRVDLTLSLISNYICTRLFTSMFPGDRSSDALDDEKLVWKV
jgi:hypothetical protein